MMPAAAPRLAEPSTADKELRRVYLAVEAYYTARVSEHGATPRGVDWTCLATQQLRFVQVLKVCDFSVPFSLNDLGCGYGALAAYLSTRYPNPPIDYLGVDLSPTMISRARRRHRNRTDRRFIAGSVSPRVADYSVSSGVMNVCLDHPRPLWEDVIAETLQAMHDTSRRGFAVNFLAMAAVGSPTEQLYRTTPEPWVRFCETELGCDVAVVSGYGLREFTLLMRRCGAAPLDVKHTLQRARPVPGQSRAAGATRHPGYARSGPVRKPRWPAVEQQGALGDALRDASLVIVSPEEHSDDARLNAAFRLLRDRSPVHWVDKAGISPFWAITRYRDIAAVERRGSNFSAAGRALLASAVVEDNFRQISGKPQLVRPIFLMDEPEHTEYRAVTQPFFMPLALGALDGWLEDFASRMVDDIAERGGICDFASDVAVPFSLRVITNILGLPESDEPLIARLVSGMMGADQSDDPPDPTINPVHVAMLGFRDYFETLIADRQAHPRDDLATVIANARIAGGQMPRYEMVSYYIIIVTAGYQTTSFTGAAGLHALMENPDQLALLKCEPGLLDNAVEEMLRWASPVRYAVRTATQVTEIGGIKIAPGEDVALFFSSGNRDAAVFDEPDRFRVDRPSHTHLAFGRGAHFCLGHHLARLELRALFREFLGRLVEVELAGPPRRANSAFVAGINSLPIRCKLAPPKPTRRATQV